MDRYITIIVDYEKEDNIDLLFDELIKKYISFWFMNKEGKIRLRVLEDNIHKIESLLYKYRCAFTVTTYEPEVYLFGEDDKCMDCIHNLLCDIAYISFKIKILSKSNNIKDFKTCFHLYFINQFIDFFELDNFEKWDVWNRVCEHRQIDINKYSKILLSKLFDVYSATNDNKFDLKNIDNECKEKINDIYLQCKQIKKLSFSKNLSRGLRGIISAIIIFSFNMFNISSQRQCAFAHIMRILNHPDFRRKLGI